MERINRIGIVGGGAWGTALATVADRAGREVLIWAREAEVVDDINARHVNSLFLPGIALKPAIRATGALAELAGHDALLLVTPAQALRAVAGDLRPHLPEGKPLVICAKGIEQTTGSFLSDVLAEVCPAAVPAVLSGPSFAADVARGLPTAVTLACVDDALAESLAAALNPPTFRPYVSHDLRGAEIGGAVKNVLAIACGICEGRGLGASARAALTTRGFAELSRFGAALGAHAETLAGLSGLGDLILTCNSPQSRNMSLGMALGRGEALDTVLGARRSVSEGVYTAAAVVARAKKLGIDMPLCKAVHGIVSGVISVDAAIDAILARPLKREGP
ncbi:MAG: NAD(P)H-dependent glycerol-3-phosphate dehydrogenase [Hyphomicrobiales bacterium]|nr:NAD(P)H-dependent glycerol-3-phosphate dehydrogenase [Hyphomicrobiales bacterium]